MGTKQLTSFCCPIIVILLLAVLQGCGTGSGRKKMDSVDDTPPVPPLENLYNHIYVYEIETTPILMNDYIEPLQRCQSTLISSLIKRNKYDTVEAGKSDDTYKKPALFVKLKINDMRIASTGARVWGGAFAGRSYMYIHMMLMDAETQKVVREEDFNSTNNPFAAAWSFGATDRNMPDHMAEIMADYIFKAVQKN